MPTPQPTPDRGRLLRAWAASAATGLLIYALVIQLGLPALATRLTGAQVGWLREQFRTHPVLTLAGVAAGAALLALPVLAVFRVVYGPLHVRRSTRWGS